MPRASPLPGGGTTVRRQRGVDRIVVIRSFREQPPPRRPALRTQRQHHLERVSRLHDAEHTDPDRHISPLRPHDLRHTFAFQLAQATNADAYELERRLGHRSQRYIAQYTNPPEHIAAAYVEDM
ncbi:MAG: tyrosine-type recombinase/integrase [Acidimicrobiia bacterium]|nr:tyrosine-type recombinase/integrase [Acidimicrobiia bacterium]